MATTEAIQRKIKTAEELQSVVKTMKALAAVNIRQYERAVESVAEYHHAVALGLQILLRHRPEATALTSSEPTQRLGVVVFGSDQGMCGMFNEQIVAHTLQSMDNLMVAQEHRFCLVVGRRVGERLENAGQPVERFFPVPSGVTAITSMVQELLIAIEEWHAGQNINRVLLFYNKHSSGMAFRPFTFQLIPVEAGWLQHLQRSPWPTRVLPTFTMDWNPLFSALIREHLFVSLYQALAESLASEQASRLVSMQGAERNIEERLAELTTQFHRQRQMSITEELLDIVSGFTALSSKKNQRGR
ncbi:MAG: F0F1 ATP synthase subunit gamma [Deltaproteobacteria bacterium]|nr:F0F1 ATP synthase subunit gamma [Deltaproteobacteria bacterium]MBW1951876.1 F0F1 ATP synthase subunit gamma [Deltaproteobacteria bacterium]MBW1986981.1 F0F1 ATP synthase subunit gamma [Deltaproteobacteria bacterium]MBW2134497.1 F0F1 ATP synthase subunit gamma [Deltaproteobacteria bacterium]